MKNVATRTGLVLACLALAFAPAVQAQNATVSGTVTDQATGRTLPGANVRLLLPNSTQMVTGAAANVDGHFEINRLSAGDYTLVFTYVGYQEARVDLSLAAGDTRTVDVALEPGGFDLNSVIVSASRQQEKVMDAPASISVLEARDLEEDVAPSSVAVLRNTPGVDVSQTGIDRRELVLRGFNNAFSGAAYTLTDYRQAAVSALGVNVYSLMPIPTIDVDRIEVVRGPGSALYGAGVDSGVIHFLTKDPFTHPGSTLMLSGGQQSFLAAQLRQAGTVGNRFGYKIVGGYAQGNDWSLDPNNANDVRQTQYSNELVPRVTDFWKYDVGAMAQYRLDDGVTLTANTGLASVKLPILTGIGTAQADGFQYTFGQVRFQMHHFFAQAYLNRNNAGDSFVYGRAGADGKPAPLVDNGTLFNLQGQYDLTTAQGRENVIFGADWDLTSPDTEGTIHGRNENHDTISEIGAYVQSTTKLSPKFDFVAALRGDHNNVQDKYTLSPRAAVVYKPLPTQTLRLTYNRAFSSPTTNSSFLDIRALEETIGVVNDVTYKLVFYGRGAYQGFTFNDYRDTGTASLILPIPVPGGGTFFDAKLPVSNFPQQFVYGAFAAGIAEQLTNADVPSSALPAPFNVLNLQQRAALANILTSLTNFIPSTATTAGVLGIPDDSELGYRQVAGPVDIDPLDQTLTQSIELGYKGLIEKRLVVALDGYYTRKENFVGPLNIESPFVYLNNLEEDLGATLSQVIQGAAAQDPQVAGFLQSLGLSPQQAAALLAGLAQSGFASTPVGVVQPDQPILPTPSTAPPGVKELGAFLTYRNFGTVDFWGVDASFQLLATDALSIFGNVSFVSDDFFDAKDLGEEGTDLSLALNAPRFKARGGFNYQFSNGLYVNVAGRYTDGFPVQSGPYVGNVDNYFLLDAGVGAAFGKLSPQLRGLRFDVTVQNVLDNQHREFVGAPRIGRLGLARLTYTLQ